MLLVGNGAEEHVGAHFRHAAQDLKIPVHFMDVRQAGHGSLLRSKINWWCRDHRPNRLGEFSEEAVLQCRSHQPKCLLSTGLAPLTADCLERIGRVGVMRINFLTDDPWNSTHRARWFLEALPKYDWVFSPRRSNLEDLKRLGCRQVHYLPFAYASNVHYPASVTIDERRRLGCDVIFAGGADADRVSFIRALIRSEVSVGLYGGYWERYAETQSYSRGMAKPDLLRRAMASATIALCLVRRANRDGHAMRSFEAPAMRSCLLMEDTQEHREIFGKDGEAVVYFQGIEEMVEKTRWLLRNPEQTKRLAEAAHHLVTEGKNTYQDRLTMLLLVTGLVHCEP